MNNFYRYSFIFCVITSSYAMQDVILSKNKKVFSLLDCAQKATLKKFFNQSPESIKQDLLLLPLELRYGLQQRINEPSRFSGNTLLHTALSSIHVLQLLALGACPAIVNNRNETPLMRFLKRRDLEKSLILLEQGNELGLDTKDIEGKSAFDLAVDLDDQEIIHLLEKRGVYKKREFVDLLLFPLGYVFDFITCHHPMVIPDLMMEKVFNDFMQEPTIEDSIRFFNTLTLSLQKKLINYINRPLSPLKITHLHCATTADEVNKLLLYADYNALTVDHETPLHYMIKLENVAAALELLKHLPLQGSCNKIDKNFMSPLCSAVLCGDVSLVQSLLDKGAHLSYFYQNCQGKVVSVFHLLAGLKNNEELIDCVIDAFYTQYDSNDPFIKEERFELLLYALEHDNRYMVKKVLPNDYFVNNSFRDKFNKKFLYYAQQKNQLSFVEKLLTTMNNHEAS